MVSWGGRIQVLGAIALMVAPFLPWVQVKVLGFELPVPGLLLHASLLLALAVLLLLAQGLGRRSPALGLASALAVAVTSLYDLRLILERTEYVLSRMQLGLADTNHMLAQLNLPLIELFKRAPSHWEYVGPGPYLALGAAAMLALGAWLEAAGRARAGRAFWWTLVGLSRCRACGWALTEQMGYCPGCGVAQGETRDCPHCHRSVERRARFCCGCGGELDSEEGRPALPPGSEPS